MASTKDKSMQRLVNLCVSTSQRFKFLLLTSTLLFIHSLKVSGQTDCILKVDKDSIQVYLCHVQESKFRSVKTTFAVNGSLSQVAAMIVDIEGYGAWQYKTISASVLKKVSDYEIIYYTEVGAPIVTSNRDFVIRLTLNQDHVTKELKVEAVSIPDYLPPKDKIVRVPFSKAKWSIKPLAAGKVFVEYYIEIDIGGAVPPWIVNVVAPEAPYQTFKAMREKIGKYKTRRVSFIKD